MPRLFQFVDSIGDSPAVRCDLNSGPLRVANEGLDLSPAPVRRAIAGTLLVHGETITAAAWSNRLLKIPVQLDAASTDRAADVLTLLGRELARETNILRVQLGSVAYFFRTFFAPDYAFTMRKLLVDSGKAMLEIPAEPFAYGLKQTLPAVTVTNDPAAGSNGCFFDVVNPVGEVETPLFLAADNGDVTVGAGSGRHTSAIGVRRRGEATTTPLVLQCESMTASTDTAIQANDTAMSGGGSNFLRCDFTTNTTLVKRAYIEPFPAAASVDTRGTYRVYGRFRKSVAGDPVTVALRAGLDTYLVANDPVLLRSITSPHWVDLGLLQFPLGADPATDGLSGTPLSVRGMEIQLYASRSSGTATLDLDVLVFVPADDRFCLVRWQKISFTGQAILDSHRSQLYLTGTSGEVRVGEGPDGPIGGAPLVTPGVTNRVTFLFDVGPDHTPGDSLTNTVEITPYYWPRYLYLRPVTG